MANTRLKGFSDEEIVCLDVALSDDEGWVDQEMEAVRAELSEELSQEVEERKLIPED